jgi:L,D-transpeptidase-like protein/putative peptidoglycan binding protein
VAGVSYLRTPAGSRSRSLSAGGLGAGRRRRRAPWIIGGLLIAVLVALAAGAFVVASSKPSLTGQSGALAKVTLPLGGGTISDVSATTGPQQHEKFVKVHLSGDPIIVPAQKVASGEKVTVSVLVHRPGWISWLTGKSVRLTKTIRTPVSQLRTRYVTLTRNGALRIRFSAPVRTIAYGASASHLTTHPLPRPQSTITLPHNGSAGTLYLSAAAQKWESASTSAVNWFPAGTKATAIARPASGQTIKSDTAITFSFSKPVSKVLGSHLPTVSPAGTGSWHTISSHEIRYVPNGYGYGLSQTVKIVLPAGVRLAGAGGAGGGATNGVWHVPGGSVTRLNQILAGLGYLPMNVHYSGAAPGNTVAAQEAAATDPPHATLNWSFGNVPSGLQSQWSGSGSAGELTKGAIMAFEGDHDMEPDGVAGPDVWKALIRAEIAGQRNTFGYTFVSVSEGSPESLFVWHNGKTVLSGIPVNTGVPGAATATGTFAVFWHTPDTRMIGTDVDGSHYNVEVKWVSYFNGGDALHYYPRGSYGSPQSNGCVEMGLSDAENVYQYTPVGTIVQVNS